MVPLSLAIVADSLSHVKACQAPERKKGDQIGLPDPLYAVNSTGALHSPFALENPEAKRIVRVVALWSPADCLQFPS